MDSIGLFSGSAGSADENIRPQKCPRKRTVEIRGRSLPTQTAFAALTPAAAILTSYFPSFEPTSRHTISLDAGTCTGGAVLGISGGRWSVTSVSSSLPAKWAVNRNGQPVGIGIEPR